MARNDPLGQIAPSRDRGLALVANNRQGPLVALLSRRVRVDIENDDVAEVAHALLRHAQQLAAILVELDALDGGRELPRLEALARLDLPEADGVVGRAAGDHGAGGIDVHSPDGANMAVVCTEALAVVGKPGTDLLILGDGEDDVAVEIVSSRGGQGSAHGTSHGCLAVWQLGRAYLIWVSARSWPERRIGLIFAS